MALAIELVGDGRVLLFPADAQLGNWLSWHDHTFKVTEPDGTKRDVKADELLRNTAFYKAGHHSSHNATLTSKGLEMMERNDLVVMIPVDRAVALKKTPPWLMPAEALYKRLLEKAKGRVIRSDTGFPEDGDLAPDPIPDTWEAARQGFEIEIKPLFVDYTLK